jgi:hypothetical protein
MEQSRSIITDDPTILLQGKTDVIVVGSYKDESGNLIDTIKAKLAEQDIEVVTLASQNEILVPPSIPYIAPPIINNVGLDYYRASRKSDTQSWKPKHKR